MPLPPGCTNKNKISIIINTAAFTDVDKSEKYKKLSMDVLGDLNKIYPNSELKIFSKEDLVKIE